MKTSDFIIGLILIVLGSLFLFENTGFIDIDFQFVWPVFIILGGGGFWIGFLRDKKNYGLIMPGTILIVYGLMFWYCALAGWDWMEYIWPGYLIGPGLGFFLLYGFGPKEKGLLIPAAVLTGLGVIFIFQKVALLRFWPLVLIFTGIWLIYKYQKQKSS